MNAGYVYVLAFTNGTVKVGRTQDTGSRLNAHKSDARKFGLTVTGQWLSPPHAEWRENEEALKAIAASLGGTAHSKEYFGGVDFGAVVEKARELTFTPAEAIAGQVVPPRAPPPKPGPTPRQRIIRDAALQRKAATNAEVDELADIYLGLGITPEYFWSTYRIPVLAQAMEGLLNEEAAVERVLSA